MVAPRVFPLSEVEHKSPCSTEDQKSRGIKVHTLGARPSYLQMFLVPYRYWEQFQKDLRGVWRRDAHEKGARDGAGCLSRPVGRVHASRPKDVLDGREALGLRVRRHYMPECAA